MSRGVELVWRGVLPILAFGFLSVSAFNYLLGEVLKAEAFSGTENDCPIPFRGESVYQLHYLNGFLPGVENFLCILVRLFYPILQPEKAAYSPWLIDLLAAMGACFVVPFIESSRAKNTPFYFGIPVLVGLAYQSFTAAVIFPIFWAVLIVFGTTVHKGEVGSQVNQAKAEGVLVGVLLGFYLPSTAMVLYPTAVPIAVWQAFPVWVAVTSTMYTLIRSKDAHKRSGHATIQLIYIIVFLNTTFAHVSMLFNYGFSLQRVYNALIPTAAPPISPEGVTAADMAIHFLQWDGVFTLGSSILASLWFARSFLHVIGILAWSAILTVTLGPGAAISTVLMWRELNLKNDRIQLAVNKSKNE